MKKGNLSKVCLSKGKLTKYTYKSTGKAPSKKKKEGTQQVRQVEEESESNEEADDELLPDDHAADPADQCCDTGTSSFRMGQRNRLAMHPVCSTRLRETTPSWRRRGQPVCME
jgi:hypothetical protein